METARSEEKKAERSGKINSAKAVVSARNGSGKPQRIVGVRKHLDKDDTSKITFDLAEKSSCLYNTTVRRFSQETGRYSFGNAKVINCLPRKEIKSPFCGKSSRFVVESLPSDEKSFSSLKSIKKLGGKLTDKGIYDSRIVGKTSCKEYRNSFGFTEGSNIKRQDIFSRFCEDKSRYHASDRSGNVNSMNDKEKEIFVKKQISFDRRYQENKFKPFKLGIVSLLKNEENDVKLKNKNYSLDIKTILNYNPSCLYSTRVLESKRAIPGTNMTINECPGKASTQNQKSFPSFSDGREKSKKPVSLPSKPVKPVRLKLKHRQDKFMNEGKETFGLEDEEERLLPITLSAWRNNSYSIMTPYMAKVVWSVMEDELTS